MGTPIFVAIVQLIIYILFFLLIRKLMLWYWRVNTLVENIEEIKELAFLLYQKDIEEKKIKVINTPTKREVEFTIKEYLNHPKKDQYKIM